MSRASFDPQTWVQAGDVWEGKPEAGMAMHLTNARTQLPRLQWGGALLWLLAVAHPAGLYPPTSTRAARTMTQQYSDLSVATATEMR